MIDSFGRTDTERAEIRARKERLNKAAFDNWDNPVWRAEAARVMTETIYEGFEHENLIGLMSDVENVGFGDRVTISEARGLRAFWTARGGYIEQSTLRKDVAEVPRDTVGFHVEESEDRIRTNFAETQANLVDLGIKRLDGEINSYFFRALQAAVQSGDPEYLSTSGVDLGTLNVALREVRDETKVPGVTIVGRSTMTDQIIDELLGSGGNGAGYLPETNEELIKRGVLGTYRGAKIVTLINHKDDEDVSFFPANELWVIGRDASKTGFFGGFMSKEYTRDEEWIWGFVGRRDAGVLVHRPEHTRRYVDSSQPA